MQFVWIRLSPRIVYLSIMMLHLLFCISFFSAWVDIYAYLQSILEVFEVFMGLGRGTREF